MHREQLIEITRSLFHKVYENGEHSWLSCLAPECVYLGSGVPVLFGSSAIRRHFENVRGKADCIVSEYFDARIEADIGYVWGEIEVADQARHIHVWTRTTLVFRKNDLGRPVITLLHNSYEAVPGDTGEMNGMPFPEPTARVPVRTAYYTHYLDPFQILYIGSRGKGSEVVCMSQSIQCPDSLGQWRQRDLPFFYPIHRTFLVNMQHVVGLRRYEVVLTNGETLPIPAARYMDVKQDLGDLLSPPPEVL